MTFFKQDDKNFIALLFICSLFLFSRPTPPAEATRHILNKLEKDDESNSGKILLLNHKPYKVYDDGGDDDDDDRWMVMMMV